MIDKSDAHNEVEVCKYANANDMNDVVNNL